MLVRLAFSLLLEVDADILLIDEVLAVGDAAFQQKCAAAFREMKAEGKTIVLVTHEMATVEEYCHRAMLISDGAHRPPRRAGRGGAQIPPPQHGGAATRRPEPSRARRDDTVRMLDARLVDADGRRVSSVEHGDEIRIEVELEALRDFAGLEVAFLLVNDDGVGVAIMRCPIGGEPAACRSRAGERIRVETAAPNLLGAGHYVVHCGINRVLEGGVALDVPGAIDFVVFGGSADRSLVSLPQRTTSTLLGSAGDERGLAQPPCARSRGRRPWAAAASASSTCSG